MDLALIQPMVEAFEKLGYTPEVRSEDGAWRVKVRFGESKHEVSMTERVLKSGVVKKVAESGAKLVHDAIVRREACRLGMLDGAYTKAVCDVLKIVDPEGFAGRAPQTEAMTRILELRYES